jgi:hypothetical protein
MQIQTYIISDLIISYPFNFRINNNLTYIEK